MADLPIASAAVLTGAGTASGDLFPLVDVSAAAGSKGSRITRDELRIAMGLTGGGTIATGGFTLTAPATGTAALLDTANVFTAAQSISVNGAASTPPLSLTGTIFTGGSATTTKPALLIEPTGTTSTNWNTSGTLFGGNAPSGFTGNLIDLQVNGASKIKVTSAGVITLPPGDSTAMSNGSAYYGFSQAGASILLWGANIMANKSGYLTFNEGAGNRSSVLAPESAGGGFNISGVDGAFAAMPALLRIFGLGTRGAANYERLSFVTTASDYTISPEAGGTGTLRGLTIGASASVPLSFYNKTPIVQPTTGISAAAFAANTSLIADDSATFGGYTIGQIAAALINIGILA